MLRNIWKIAARKPNLRFQSVKGSLTLQQLWGLSIQDLDKLAVKLKEESEAIGTKSFISAAPKGSYTAKLKFDIVYDVLTTKLAEDRAASERLENKAHNAKILERIEAKEDAALDGLSVAELKAQLKPE